MIFGVVESWAGMLQTKPAVSKNFPEPEGYCGYTFNRPIKISIDGQQCNGLDKLIERPTDYNLSHWSLLIDGQLRFIHWIGLIWNLQA